MRSPRFAVAATTVACLSALSASAAPAPRGGHPEPRVVVDVVRVAGPHQRAEIEREARKALWGKIVGCYRPAAAKKPGLKGEATLKLRVAAAGGVSAVRPGPSTFGDADLVACLRQHVAELALPKAPADSDVEMEIHVAPGDPPGTGRPR